MIKRDLFSDGFFCVGRIDYEVITFKKRFTIYFRRFKVANRIRLPTHTLTYKYKNARARVHLNSTWNKERDVYAHQSVTTKFICVGAVLAFVKLDQPHKQRSLNNKLCMMDDGVWMAYWLQHGFTSLSRSVVRHQHANHITRLYRVYNTKVHLKKNA